MIVKGITRRSGVPFQFNKIKMIDDPGSQLSSHPMIAPVTTVPGFDVTTYARTMLSRERAAWGHAEGITGRRRRSAIRLALRERCAGAHCERTCDQDELYLGHVLSLLVLVAVGSSRQRKGMAKGCSLVLKFTK
jgi:hypothetical protein